MKNWPLLLVGLALLGVVLLVFLGETGDGSQASSEKSQPNTVETRPETGPLGATGIAEAGMDRRDAEPSDRDPALSGVLPEGFVQALPFTGDAAHLTLRLLDGQDRPAAGAYLRVDLAFSGSNETLAERGLLDEEAWSTGNQILADANGQISIDLPALANLSLALLGPTWRQQVRALQPLAAGDDIDLGDVHLSPAHLLHGMIHGPDGQAIDQARLSLKPAGANYWGGGYQTTVQSEEDGSYQLLGVPAGSYQLTINAPGFVQHQVERLELGQEEQLEQDFELSRGKDMRGQVFDQAGQPLAEASVYLTILDENANYWGDWRPPVPDGEAQATTDANGGFTLSGGLEGKRFLVGARAEGHAAAQVEVDGGATDISLRLDPAFALSGHVLSEDGDPIADISLGLVRIKGADDEESLEWQTTDDKGAFTFTPQAAGSYRIDPQDTPTEVEPLTLELDRDREDLVFQLAAGQSLRVQVLAEDGRPVSYADVMIAPPGQLTDGTNLQSLGYSEVISDSFGSVSFSNFGSVSAGGSSATTDEQGWAKFPVLASGDYEMQVQAMGYAKHQQELSLGLQPKEETVTLHTGASLQLLLQDDVGLPVEGLPVTLKNAASGEELTSVSTDALGRAVWQELEAGLYQIAYRANDADGWWWNQDDSQEVAHDQPVVELKAGEHKEETLIVRDLALLTVVIRRAGLPAAGIGVRLEEVREDNNSWYGGNQAGAPTDGRGEIELAPVKAGKYTVIVKSSLDTPAHKEEIELHGGAQRLEIQLNGARIEGLLRGKDNQPLVGARVSLAPFLDELSSEQEQKQQANMVTIWTGGGLEFTNSAEMSTATRTDAQGRYSFRDVPEGRWQVIARAEGHGPWRSQALHVRGQGDLDAGDHRLPAMAVIEGQDLNWQPNQAPSNNNNFFNWNNSVQLLHAETQQNLGMAAVDENGHFRLEDLGAGSYRLRKGQYLSDPITLREGEQLRMNIPLEEKKDQ